jgi:hypothetical protein
LGQLATMTAGDNSPDVIQMDESYIAAYGARDALLDLGTVKDNLDLSAMDAKVLGTGKVGGTLVGAPIGVANFSVGVNPEVLKKAGVSMPNDETWTWDQFAQVAAQVTGKVGSQGVYGLDGFGTGAAELGAWARQEGDEVWPTEGPGVSEATITSFFDYANKLVAMKATPPAGRQVDNATAVLDQSLFATNKAAFHLLFHTQISAFGTASGMEMKLLRIPAQATAESPKMVDKASMVLVGVIALKARRGQRQTDRLLAHRSCGHQGPHHRARHPGDPGGAKGDRSAAGSAGDDRARVLAVNRARARAAAPSHPAQRLRLQHRVHSRGHRRALRSVQPGGRRCQGARDHPEHEVVDGGPLVARSRDGDACRCRPGFDSGSNVMLKLV